MLASVAQVEALVDEEIRSTGIAAERIVVGGFSQGAGLSLLLAITTEKKVSRRYHVVESAQDRIRMLIVLGSD